MKALNIRIGKTLSFNECYQEDAYLLARKRREGIRKIVKLINKNSKASHYQTERFIDLCFDDHEDEMIESVLNILVEHQLHMQKL